MGDERKPVYVHCGACEHEWIAFYTPLKLDENGMRLMKSASKACPMCAKPKVMMGRSPAAIAEEGKHIDTSAPEMERALNWVSGNDTGLSSETIWRVMMGREVGRVSYPHDPDDFGRCARLLRLIPEWRPRLKLMAGASVVWAALVDRWDEIADAMEAEVGIDWSKGRSAPKTYELMKSILRPVEGQAHSGGLTITIGARDV